MIRRLWAATLLAGAALGVEPSAPGIFTPDPGTPFAEGLAALRAERESVAPGYDRIAGNAKNMGQELARWTVARAPDGAVAAVALPWADALVAGQSATGAPGGGEGTWNAWGDLHRIHALAALQERFPERPYREAIDRALAAYAEAYRQHAAKPAGGRPAAPLGWTMELLATLPERHRGPAVMAVLRREFDLGIPDLVTPVAGVRSLRPPHGANIHATLRIAAAGLRAGPLLGERERAERYAVVVQQWYAHHGLSPVGCPWGDVENTASLPASLHFKMENCGLHAWTMLLRDLLAATGDGQYAALLEAGLLNHASTGRNLAWSGTAQPSRQRRMRPHLADALGDCCINGTAMVLENLNRSIVDHDADTLSVNIHHPGRYQAPGIGLEVQGSLARDGRSAIRFTGASTRRLRIRVADWLEEPVLRRAGRPIRPAVDRGYWLVPGPFTADDEITIEGTLSLRVVDRPWSTLPDAEFRRKGTPDVLPFLVPGGYLRRGPLVYGIVLPFAQASLAKAGTYGIAELERDAPQVLPTAPVLDAVAVPTPHPGTGPAFRWSATGGAGALLLPYADIRGRLAGQADYRMLLHREGTVAEPIPPPLLAGGLSTGTRIVELVEIRPPLSSEAVADSWVTYTLDGSVPGPGSPRLAGPVAIPPGATLGARRFTERGASAMATLGAIR